MVSFKLTIPGEPMGKQRARTVTGHSYTPEKTVNYETLVKQLFVTNHCPYIGSTDPKCPAQLAVTIEAYFSIPQSVPIKKRVLMIDLVLRPTKKPDWDNIGKIVCDALNGYAYRDDAQIVDGRVRKFYSADQPRVEITIEEVGAC